MACFASGFKVRGLTRNPNSDKAKKLMNKGCEVVQVDNYSPDSI